MTCVQIVKMELALAKMWLDSGFPSLAEAELLEADRYLDEVDDASDYAELAEQADELEQYLLPEVRDELLE